MFFAYSSLADDSIYIRNHIYNPQFSNKSGIQVGQVFPERYVPSNYYLKVQHWKIRMCKVLCMQVQREIIDALAHKASLFQQHVV